MRVMYVADDYTTFNSREECEAYENSLKEKTPLVQRLLKEMSKYSTCWIIIDDETGATLFYDNEEAAMKIAKLLENWAKYPMDILEYCIKDRSFGDICEVYLQWDDYTFKQLWHTPNDEDPD